MEKVVLTPQLRAKNKRTALWLALIPCVVMVIYAIRVTYFGVPASLQKNKFEVNQNYQAESAEQK